jgi:hypothetical protein
LAFLATQPETSRFGKTQPITIIQTTKFAGFWVEQGRFVGAGQVRFQSIKVFLFHASKVFSTTKHILKRKRECIYLQWEE